MISQKGPELVIGVAGPIGVDIDAITFSIESALQNVGYTSDTIKLTKEMRSYPVNVAAVEEDDFPALMNFKMDYANKLCETHDDPSFLARIAIRAVRKHRSEHTKDEDVVRNNHCYIVRQLKRPEEIHLLRGVYGKQFILVSAYGSIEDRKRILENRCGHSASTMAKGSARSAAADTLIERDEGEGENIGQQLRDTFHLADVFIDGINKSQMDLKLVRFFRALFGLNTAAPTRDEYGMYTAKSASLRSCDLSRQVGAAIFTLEGEIVTQGCNEVPKPKGGAYWDVDEPDSRDIKIGYDANDDMKREILRNVIERLWEARMLSDKAMSYNTSHKFVDELLRRPIFLQDDEGALINSTLMDLTEFGRAVHAEMSAICDAARLGKEIKRTTLYCTTFPCHNCAKHIVACGIMRVVFMEPYPKSKAKQLHQDAIEIEKESENKVSFVPFMGISPLRYRDIFAKQNKRKNNDGRAREWYSSDNVPTPMIETAFTFYPSLEKAALAPAIGSFKAPS